MTIRMRMKNWIIWKTTMHTITIQKTMTTMTKTKLKVKNQSLLKSEWSSHEDGAHRMECNGSYRMMEHVAWWFLLVIAWNLYGVLWLAGLKLLMFILKFWYYIQCMYVNKLHKNDFFSYIVIMSETCHHYRMATKLIPLEKSVNPNSDLSY